MSVTVGPPAAARATRPVAAPAPAPAPRLADGLELLGEIHGSGYKEGAALVRRADGQMGPLGAPMYGLLPPRDGPRDVDALAGAMANRLGRQVEREHVVALAGKLAA